MELSFSSLRIGKDYKRVNAGSMEALRSFSLMVLVLELFWPWDPIISFTTIAIGKKPPIQSHIAFLRNERFALNEIFNIKNVFGS